MLTASLLVIALIASLVAVVSVLYRRGQSRSINLSEESKIMQRALSGSEVKVEVVELNCNSAFQSLSANQQKYAHFATRVFFESTLSVFFEISTEAAGVFIMLYRLFAFESMEKLRKIAEACNFTDDEWNNFIVWSALRLSCYANRRSPDNFSAPRVDQGKFKNLIASSKGGSAFPGTRRLAAPLFADIYELQVFPRPETISENIEEFSRNAYRKFYESMETAKLDHDYDQMCGFIDPKSRIRFSLFDIHPPGMVVSCNTGQSEYSEGFVGICNIEINKTFARLTNNFKYISKKLPWGMVYENDVANPTLTAFDVIAFTFHGGVMEGERFSNECCHVYRNLLIAEPNKLILKEEDLQIIGEYRWRAKEMQTALHELFGHGSGKLFMRSSDGVFNFDKNKTVDILTGGRITSWYEPGETYKSVFGDFAKPFEECRAEAVGFMLSCDMEVLKLFGYTGDSAEKIMYANCLIIVNAALDMLVNYDVKKKTWGECAYSWAHFVLLKVLLEAGEGYLTIEKTTYWNGDGLSIRMDGTKIDSVGVSAVRELLKKLQALKSTADVKEAREFFDRYSVGPTEVEWISILLKSNTPPTVILQPNTVMNADGKVELRRYPLSAEGVIQSIVERYTIETIDEFEKLWRVEMEKSDLVG